MLTIWQALWEWPAKTAMLFLQPCVKAKIILQDSER